MRCPNLQNDSFIRATFFVVDGCIIGVLRDLTAVFVFTLALPTRCTLRLLNRHGNNGRVNQGDAKDQHGKCQNQGTQVDQPDRAIRVLGSR
jgi:hypothetical protein